MMMVMMMMMMNLKNGVDSRLYGLSYSPSSNSHPLNAEPSLVPTEPPKYHSCPNGREDAQPGCPGYRQSPCLCLSPKLLSLHIQNPRVRILRNGHRPGRVMISAQMRRKTPSNIMLYTVSLHITARLARLPVIKRCCVCVCFFGLQCCWAVASYHSSA